jgi:glycosyltransferase involved in cell wall biosynthesis
MHHLSSSLGAPFLLFVGQLLPHKRPDLLVEAAHIASTYLEVDAYLMLVGHARLQSYQRAIVELVRELNLPRVHVVGTVSTPDLVAFYANARALVTASEHEGFCVPLLEAMAFRVPIVARACGAIPETVANGGLLLPPDGGPALMAEAFAAVVHDDALHRDLVDRGQQRMKCFDPQQARAEFVDALLQAV